MNGKINIGGSSDFLKWAKTGKEHPVVITLLIWEMGGTKVSFIILLIEKMGNTKYHLGGNKVSFIILLIEKWGILGYH